MKEYLIKVPDEAEQVITAVMEKFGVETTIISKNKASKKTRPKKDKTQAKPKIDHTYLFGKWKDFDIDAEKLRDDVWKR